MVPACVCGTRHDAPRQPSASPAPGNWTRRLGGHGPSTPDTGHRVKGICLLARSSTALTRRTPCAAVTKKRGLSESPQGTLCLKGAPDAVPQKGRLMHGPA